MNQKSTTLGTGQYAKKDKASDEFDKFKESLGVLVMVILRLIMQASFLRNTALQGLVMGCSLRKKTLICFRQICRISTQPMTKPETKADF